MPKLSEVILKTICLYVIIMFKVVNIQFSVQKQKCILFM